LIDKSALDDGSPAGAAFDSIDVERLHRTAREAVHAARIDIHQLIPGIPATTAGLLAENCEFGHRAVLLFPATVDAAMDYLGRHGFDPLSVVRSILVRRRLADRYQLHADDCDVWLTRCRPPEPASETGPAASRTLEVFLFPRSAPVLQSSIVDGERTFGFEEHIALTVHEPDTHLLTGITTALSTDARLLLETGAHIPHEGPQGSTAMYFVRQSAPASAGGRLQRLELHCPGDFTALLATLLPDSNAAAEAACRIYDNHVRTVRRTTPHRVGHPAQQPAVA